MGNVLKAALVCELLAVSAAAQWLENFDAYPNGQSLHRVGGWKGWENLPGHAARVSDAQSRSAPHAVEIGGAADLTHEFVGYMRANWSFVAWLYVPAEFSGLSSLELWNAYEDFGSRHSSVRCQADALANRFVCGSAALPLVRGRWTEIRIDVDLISERYAVYYDGQVLLGRERWRWPWDRELPGAPDIAAVELRANGASPVYYDDLAIVRTVGACCDDATGLCVDNVRADDCLELRQRFAAFKTCAQFDPPCGTARGACCPHDLQCSHPCEENLTYAECAARPSDWVWLGAGSTCYECNCMVFSGDPEGEPPCGPGYIDTYNAGCSGDALEPRAIEAFQPGQQYRRWWGRSGTYVTGGLRAHDVDWYHVRVGSVPTQLVVEFCTEFDVIVGLYDNNGRPYCESKLLKPSKFAYG